MTFYFESSLIQDISGHKSNHLIYTDNGSELYYVCGTGYYGFSSHHQAIKVLGNDLNAIQWAPDGTIEAAKHTYLPVMGVLWHPEWSGNVGTALLSYFTFTVCRSNPVY